jgi:glycosyltransferase involved in cell wall biosynthesis
MNSPSRWLTCAPRDYRGDAAFFARDTGLLCRGLQDAGVGCRAVLAGAPRPDDEPDILRASLPEMADASWWRRQEARVVVIHTWSRGESTAILRAIREAGCRIVLLQDGSGITGPLGTWADWVRESWYLRRKRAGKWLGPLWFLARMLHGHSLRLAGFERERKQQFALADIVAVPSPAALAGYQKLCHHYGKGSASKLKLLPHPVAAWFHWDGVPPKEDLVIAVGRWDDCWQKRPDLLRDALDRCLADHPRWQAEIYGNPSPLLRRWLSAAPPDIRSRVRLMGHVSNRQLAEGMLRARISLCSSAYESFHIVSGEALCSGASVVGTDSPMTPSLRWFASEKSGTLAPRLKGHSLAAALAHEMAAWEAGDRDPAAISTIWRSRLHAAEVARALLAQGLDAGD